MARLSRLGLLLGITVAVAGCAQPNESGSTTGNVDQATDSGGVSDEDLGDGDSQSSEDETETFDLNLEVASWDQTVEKIASHRGKVVVVDLWSTSCEPCMREFHNLVELQADFADDVVCISVNCDFDGLTSDPVENCVARAKTFLASQKAAFPNIALNTPASQVWESIDIAAIPCVYVYGRDGEVMRRFSNDDSEYGDEGFTYKDHIRPLVEQLLADGT